MKRDEAIKVLNTYDVNFDEYTAEEIADAIDMAIEALHREEAEEKGYCHRIRPSAETHKIRHLPSAEAVQVVRCKDCMHWRPHCQLGYDEDFDEYHDYCALLIPDDDYYAYTRKADDFCSHAERRPK